MSNPKANAEQIKELLEFRDGYRSLDRDGRFMIVDREGICYSDRSSAAGSLAVLRFLRAGYRAGKSAGYQVGKDDGYWIAKREGRKLAEEILNA